MIAKYKKIISSYNVDSYNIVHHINFFEIIEDSILNYFHSFDTKTILFNKTFFLSKFSFKFIKSALLNDILYVTIYFPNNEVNSLCFFNFFKVEIWNQNYEKILLGKGYISYD